MEGYIWWAIIGIALVIAELATATFYLLVIGIAALAGAVVSYLNYEFWAQAIVAVAVATIGVGLATRFRAARTVSPDIGLDVGQSAVFDAWVSEKDRLARVRYRNALWDAQILDTHNVDPGDVLYIKNVAGSTLHVSKIRTA
jgi:membrane protein implicated in regulation of membrane protease activity